MLTHYDDLQLAYCVRTILYNFTNTSDFPCKSYHKLWQTSFVRDLTTISKAEECHYVTIYLHVGQPIANYKTWLKKMDSISYVYIFWTIHGMWMIYITFERWGPKFSNTTARALA